MKSTGITRKIDQLGRLVLPKEVRTSLNLKDATPLEDGSALEIYVEGDLIILKKYEPGCKCCNALEQLTTVNGISLCTKCLEEFKKARGMIAFDSCR